MTFEEWKRLNPGKSINDYYAQDHPEDEMGASHMNAAYHRKEKLNTPRAPLGIYYIPLQAEAMRRAVDPQAVSRLRNGLCPFGSGQGVDGKDYILVGLNRMLYRQPVYQDGEELERVVYETLGAYIPYNPAALAEFTKSWKDKLGSLLIVAGMAILGLFGLGIIILVLLDMAGLQFDFTVPVWLMVFLFVCMAGIVVVPRFLPEGESILAKVIRLPDANSNWEYGFQQSGKGYPHALTQMELSTFVRQGKLIQGALEWTK